MAGLISKTAASCDVLLGNPRKPRHWFPGLEQTSFSAAASHMAPRVVLSFLSHILSFLPLSQSPPSSQGDHSQHWGEECCHPAASCHPPGPAQGPEWPGAPACRVPVGTTPPELCSPPAAGCPVCPGHCKNTGTPSEAHVSPNPTSLPSRSVGGRQRSRPLKSSPGGQGPAEHLAAVLHYVAVAVGILHTVLPSPGPLNLK